MPTPLYRRRAPPPRRLSPPEAEPYSDSEEEIVEEDVGDAREEDEEEDEFEQALEQEDDEALEQEDYDEEVEEDALASPLPSPNPLVNNAPPPNFREISTLASWTVSSSKPGCSIPQLRHPSTQLFWQSDGPQPHYLNIHFFKLVRVVGLRVFLDFEADESYTPTRIVLLAGSGMNDLVEWGEMRLENPRGWIWADFEGVRDPESDSDSDSGPEFDPDIGDAPHQTTAPVIQQDQNATPLLLPLQGTQRDEDQTSDFENAAPNFTTPTPATTNTHAQRTPAAFTPTNPTTTTAATTTLVTPTNLPLPRPSPRHPFTPLHPTANPTSNRGHGHTKKPSKLPVLRCHLIQIKILENHQNGKDTHLRGLQVFALNERDGAAAMAPYGRRRGGGGRGGGVGAIGSREGRGGAAAIMDINEDDGIDLEAILGRGRGGGFGGGLGGDGGGGLMIGEEPHRTDRTTWKRKKKSFFYSVLIP